VPACGRVLRVVTPARALAVLLALACAAAPGAARAAGSVADSAAADSARRSQAAIDVISARGVDYLWVLRNSLVRAEDIPVVIARAKAMHVRGLLVQVVGRGDAWYRSDLLPRPEPLQGAGRDPLGELLPLAHAAGLEVYAWVNCCLVWSGPHRPRDPRHVVNAHPEWIARMADGRPMTRLTPRQRGRLRVEGVFLSPTHPGVRHWLAAIVKEIVTRYPVDGIQLDYIRQPGIAIGYDPTSRARFALEQGVDPLTFSRRPPAERARLEALWTTFQQEQVTAIVREVRDSLTATRPGLPLSAAVLADTSVAWRKNRQTWSLWVRDGLLDRAFLMCYAPMLATVLDQLTAVSAQIGVDRIVPGIAMYNTSLSTAATKIKAARALGFHTIALYSYDSLFERPGQWERLGAFLTEHDPSEVQP
jgi:uncharacterized lipoprotein YddW (UPF0748 family)